MRNETLFFFAFLGASGSACNPLASDGECGAQITSELPSPGATARAVVWQVNCGATTGYSIVYTISPAGKRLAYDLRQAFASHKEHSPSLVLSWLDDQNLSASGYKDSLFIKRTELRVGESEYSIRYSFDK